MKASKLHHSFFLISMLFFTLFCGVFYSSYSKAQTPNSLAGTQLAFFVGYHSGGMYKGPVYYKPQYHYRGADRTPWTYIGHTCRKTCLVDRWTGRALRCYKTC